MPVAPKLTESAETPAQLNADLLQWEREGGELWEAFQSFVAAERARYATELGTVSSTARERLLAAFDRPEKRRSLLRAWRLGEHSA
jgi:CRISPR/Cas system-associated protein Csm6